MSKTTDEAVLKLKRESAKKPKGQAAKAVASFVCKTLCDLCEQNEEFADAICQKDQSVADCCDEVTKNIGTSISDIDLIRKATEFYFPGAKVEMNLCIYMCDAEKPAEPVPEQKKAVILSLFDL